MTAVRTAVTIVTSVFVLSISTLGAIPAAEAGEKDVTDRQQQLNDRGVEAIEDGDYDKAVELYESSLELGQLNIIHANLGRAHQLAGNCEQADKHFARALDAPAVDAPPPEVIESTLDDYRNELQQDCPGFLKIDCSPAELDLFIDGDGPETCSGDRREKMPGDYDLRGEYDDHSVETSVTVNALTTARAELQLDDKLDDTVEPPPTVDDPSPTVPAWTWLAASGVAITGGVLLDTVPQQARNYEVNAINFVPVGLYAAGATMAFIGIRGMF